MQYFTRFQLTARSRGPSATAAWASCNVFTLHVRKIITRIMLTANLHSISVMLTTKITILLFTYNHALLSYGNWPALSLQLQII